jgi:TonB-dependent receptor
VLGEWRLVGGARIEDNRIHVASATGSAPPYAPLSQDLKTVDLLPSLNLIYSLSPEMNLRLGYGGTVARPELRELAPFRFDDYRRSTYGNPYLEETRVRNYDLRWEWFPGIGELLSASFFYKSFDRPIEYILLPDPTTTADVRPIGTANSRSAYVVGSELELRQSLDVVASVLAPFNVSVNLTALKSEITQGDSVVVFAGSREVYSTANQALVTNLVRPLQGQSPYVVNVNLGYTNPESNTTVTLLYNVAGRRLTTVGTTGFDDTYEQARNQVDLTASQILFNTLQVKLSVRNLLDDDFAFKLGETYTNRYKAGRSFSLALSYTL